MKKIEIPTAQNIKIDYVLPNVAERGVAFFLDNMIVGLWWGLIALLTGLFAGSSGNTIIYILVLPLILFYHLSFELFNHGQTPGKKVMGIRVMKIDGNFPDFRSYLIRYVFRLVDIYLTATTVGVLFIVGSARNQRLGDYFADTTVVKIKGGRRYHLKSVISSLDPSPVPIVHENATKLREEEMLLTQEALQRYKQFRNSGHSEVLKSVATKIAEVLGLPEQADSLHFLEQVVRDYVQLTR